MEQAWTRTTVTAAAAAALVAAVCLGVLALTRTEHTPQSASRAAFPRPGRILVLGSGGVVGRALVEWLHRHHYETLQVQSRAQVDLRLPGSLDRFNDTAISFVFFLACEVGGSKYLYHEDTQTKIIQHNLQIYENVFPWLKRRKIPFIFSSSSLQNQATTYGTIKRLGEQWIKAIGLGKSARLWNVYGYEHIGLKSHVISDLIHGCLTKHKIDCATNARERRQFLHADDCASAIGTMMQLYEVLPEVTDVSSSRWTTIEQVANLVANMSTTCSVSKSTTSSQALAEIVSPDTSTPLHSVWQPTISLRQGVASLYNKYNESLAEHQPVSETANCNLSTFEHGIQESYYMTTDTRKLET